MTDETKQYAVGDVVQWRDRTEHQYLVTKFEANGVVRCVKHDGTLGMFYTNDSNIHVITPAAGAPLRYCRWRFEGGKVGDWVSCGGTPRKVVRWTERTCLVELDVLHNMFMEWDLVGDIVPAPEKTDAKQPPAGSAMRWDQRLGCYVPITDLAELVDAAARCIYPVAASPLSDDGAMERMAGRQPEVTACSECRAPLREEQISTRGVNYPHDSQRRREWVMCAYCSTRVMCYCDDDMERGAKWRHTIGQTLDARIAAAQPKPDAKQRHVGDWDVFCGASYEEP